MPLKSLFFVLFSIVAVHASAQKPIDSILSNAASLVFTNPDNAINIAMEFLDDSNITAETRVRSLIVVSTAYLSKRDYENALEYALKVNENLDGLDSKFQIITLNQIGGIYQSLKIYDKAIEYLDASLKISEDYPYPDSIPKLLGINYATRGFIYREQMNCDIALNFFNRSVSEFEKVIDLPNMRSNLSITLYNKGNCLRELNRLEEAKQTFIVSEEFAILQDAKTLIGYAKKGRAEVLTLESNYETALQLLHEAESEAYNSGDLVLNKSIFQGMANNYLALHQYGKYQEYLSKYEELVKETTMRERRSLNKSIAKALLDKNQIINEAEKKNKWQIVLSGAIILILTLSCIYFVVRSERKLHRIKQTLGV